MAIDRTNNLCDLNEDWNGIERLTPEWDAAQEKGLTKYIDMIDQKDVDILGIITMFKESYQGQVVTASLLTVRYIKDLLYVSIGDPKYTKYWLVDYDNARFSLKLALGIALSDDEGDQSLKNILKDKLPKIYESAIKEAKSSLVGVDKERFDFSRVPDDCPWTIDNLINDSHEDLLSRIKLKY